MSPHARPRAAAATAAGIHRDTLYRWLRVDPLFAAAVGGADARAAAALIEAISAVADTPRVICRHARAGRLRRKTVVWDWRLAAWLLENDPRQRDRWRPPEGRRLLRPRLRT